MSCSGPSANVHVNGGTGQDRRGYRGLGSDGDPAAAGGIIDVVPLVDHAASDSRAIPSDGVLLCRGPEQHHAIPIRPMAPDPAVEDAGEGVGITDGKRAVNDDIAPFLIVRPRTMSR